MKPGQTRLLRRYPGRSLPGQWRAVSAWRLASSHPQHFRWVPDARGQPGRKPGIDGTFWDPDSSDRAACAGPTFRGMTI